MLSLRDDWPCNEEPAVSSNSPLSLVGGKTTVLILSPECANSKEMTEHRSLCKAQELSEEKTGSISAKNVLLHLYQLVQFWCSARVIMLALLI